MVHVYSVVCDKYALARIRLIGIDIYLCHCSEIFISDSLWIDMIINVFINGGDCLTASNMHLYLKGTVLVMWSHSRCC